MVPAPRDWCPQGVGETQPVCAQRGHLLSLSQGERPQEKRACGTSTLDFRPPAHELMKPALKPLICGAPICLTDERMESPAQQEPPSTPRSLQGCDVGSAQHWAMGGLGTGVTDSGQKGLEIEHRPSSVWRYGPLKMWPVQLLMHG